MSLFFSSILWDFRLGRANAIPRKCSNSLKICFVPLTKQLEQCEFLRSVRRDRASSIVYSTSVFSHQMMMFLLQVESMGDSYVAATGLPTPRYVCCSISWLSLMKLALKVVHVIAEIMRWPWFDLLTSVWGVWSTLRKTSSVPLDLVLGIYKLALGSTVVLWQASTHSNGACLFVCYECLIWRLVKRTMPQRACFVERKRGFNFLVILWM